MRCARVLCGRRLRHGIAVVGSGVALDLFQENLDEFRCVGDDSVIVITLGVLAVLLVSMLRSIQSERSRGRSVWRAISLGLILMMMFFATWVAHMIAEWRVFTDEQLAHGADPQVGDFVAEFAKSTLENWQSEFLQLFSFVVLAALYIHKGSAESNDGEENIEASLRRIEQHLGTLPASVPSEPGEDWKLPKTPRRCTIPRVRVALAVRSSAHGGSHSTRTRSPRPTRR